MQQKAKDYDVKTCAVSDLSETDRTRCLLLIAEGGAVDERTAGRNFPRAGMIAVAREAGEVVGVGAIKPTRADYAAGIAKKAKFAFDSRTPELGYAVVDPAHRGNRLSSAMAKALSQGRGVNAACRRRVTGSWPKANSRTPMPSSA